MEALWLVFVVLVIINFILFLVLGLVLHRLGKLESYVHTLFSDPYEFDYMMTTLDLERRRRHAEEMHRSAPGSSPPTDITSTFGRRIEHSPYS